MSRREAFDVASVRAQFPALAQPQVFLDNAGGSQTLETVISSYISFSTLSLAHCADTGVKYLQLSPILQCSNGSFVPNS